MYSILAAVALVASLASADNLPVPRTMCSATDSSKNKYGVVTLGPVMCAMADAPSQAPQPSVPFTDEECTPAFCWDSTLVEICKLDGNPGAVSWTEISRAMEQAFVQCSGVARNSDNTFWKPHHKSWDGYVQFQPFSHVDKGWQMNVRGDDCSKPGNTNAGKSWSCQE